MSVRGATVVLVGRPNCGKSSLFNLLTGGGAKVANFPGITVDVIEGVVDTAQGKLRIVDLPGLYSLEPTADPDSDEGQARAFLDREKEARVVQIADATRLALSLRLFRELAEKDGAALVVTQRDVLDAEGRTLDEKALSDAIGAPVLAVSARSPSDRQRLIDFFRAPAETKKTSFDPDEVAARVVRDRDDAGAPAQEKAKRVRERTARLDALLLHPMLGPVLFALLMTAIFSVVFALADPATQVIDAFNRSVGGFATARLGDGWIASLLVDGILGGAGTVLSFLPQIVVLTVALEIVEASGYLARGAFLVDRLLRIAGLGGRSFVPLLTAHACAVPAIGATRIVRDPGQRLRTILVLPLMTCAARIPTYTLLIQAFFGHRSPAFRAAIFVGLYFAGLVTGFLASLALGKTVPKAGKRLPLVLEMPSYRMPQAAVVARTAWRTCKRFVRDVGTGILAASIALWILLTVPAPGSSNVAVPDDATPRVAAMHRSVAARVGHAIEPITQHAGFDWRLDVGLIGSFGARELMVSTIGVIFGIEDTDQTAPLAQKISRAYSVPTGLALLAFFVIACQCMSTLMAIRRETRSWRWPAFVFAYTYVCAFALSVIVNKLALFLS